MAKKGHKPEEIVAKLRQADVLVSQGRSEAEVAFPRFHGHCCAAEAAAWNAASFCSGVR
jgi:hypothetical protein